MKRAILRAIQLTLMLTVVAQIARLSIAKSGSEPDLTGVWHRPGPKELLTAVTADSDGAPMTPWGQERYKVNHSEPKLTDKGRDEMDPSQRFCMPMGMPRNLIYSIYPVEIIQRPGHVYMLFESYHEVRRIFTDGRAHPADLSPSFMGHSIGHWEGDTLVVDTVGIDPRSWLDPTGIPHSDQLHITERIRRTDTDTLTDELTFEDPKAFTKPWTSERTWKLEADWDIDEYNECEDHWPKALSAAGTPLPTAAD